MMMLIMFVTQYKLQIISDSDEFHIDCHFLDNVNVMKTFSYKLRDGISGAFRVSNDYRHKR